MKIAGIICEYNPFHQGHAYQVAQLKSQGFSVISLMSGNFVQRGDLAIFPKELRTQVALNCGVDLVLEMPMTYSLSSADPFAKGCISLFDQLQVVDVVSFGVEEEEFSILENIAVFLSQDEIQQQLKNKMKSGYSYGVAVESFVEDRFGQEAGKAMKKSNNILGVEYMKALYGMKSTIKPLPIQRVLVSHQGSKNQGMASGTYLREQLNKQNFSEFFQFVPEPEIYQDGLAQGQMAQVQRIERGILLFLRRCPLTYFQRIPDVSGGFHHKIYQEVKKAISWDGLVEALVDKTHTRANVRRILWNGFLGITKEKKEVPLSCVHSLGFSKEGEEMLKKIGNHSKLPVLAKMKKLCDLGYPLEAVEATDLYQLALEIPRPAGMDFTTGILKPSSDNGRVRAVEDYLK